MRPRRVTPSANPPYVARNPASTLTTASGCSRCGKWPASPIISTRAPEICLGKLLRINRRDDAIGLAPDDQRRRGDAVAALGKAAVGDRPDELAGAGLRPDELRLGLDAFRGVGRHIEEALRHLAVGIGEQPRTARLGGKDHPVLHRMIVKPQADRIDQRQAADRLRRWRRRFRRRASPPKEWPTTAGAASLSASNSSP